jgi:fructose-1,6-bisphosphatase/inositol monophosphatase family enzyme
MKVSTTAQLGIPLSPYLAELELAKSAALKAGEMIRKYSGNCGRSNNSAAVCVKSGVDLVTEADTHVERVVSEMIKVAFPKDDIVGEEDQIVGPKGGQDDPFPAGRIWCGKYRS